MTKTALIGRKPVESEPPFIINFGKDFITTLLSVFFLLILLTSLGWRENNLKTFLLMHLKFRQKEKIFHEPFSNHSLCSDQSERLL